ncbi:AraC family transcriptional regulator [Cohnella fermenti]|uniref:Helix-turn-helix domain-containing protein n=1 Tax=Cohnella fermenti TaxID=2565925 RepID=A0A4S4C4F1_9BACL|nr:AraC family transcriptional regulator [Cohnella fermenti]THF82656.1 helix-turn-helix domain-containing protein [Cohnella fermenti]
MKRIPMTVQLVFILFCVMAIPTVILTWYSGAQILRNSEHAIAESSLAGLNANRNLNENALNNLTRYTVLLTDGRIFDRIRDYETFAEINSTYSTISNGLSVQQQLTSMNNMSDGVNSSFFYLSDSDYVVSTDKGITKLDRYESLEWLDDALEGQRGIAGVWYPRKLKSGAAVISYVLPLNRLTSTTRGTIVLNLDESQVEQYLRNSGEGQQEYVLMSRDGTIISHADKSLLYTNGNEDPAIRDILGQTQEEGYMFREAGGKRMLYTWSRSTQLDWTYVSLYSVDELMANSQAMHRNIVILTVAIIVAGTILTYFLAIWVSKPARELVRTLRTKGGLGIQRQNELVFLDDAFKRMQEEEEALNRLLHAREKDARSLAVHQLLRNEWSASIDEIFPSACFVVAVLSIDRYRTFVSNNSPETRSYHRYQVMTECEAAFPENMQTQCVYHGEGCFALVINYEQVELGDPDGVIHDRLVKLRDNVSELLGNTVTIGVSRPTEDRDLVSNGLVEAMEAIKHRMISGSGEIAYWQEEDGREGKYIYPVTSERRILNYLDQGDLDNILRELQFIGSEIRSAEYVSYDNIMFLYHQLAGVTIKHLRENNVSTARIFAGRGNIYAALASLETLDELEDYLRDFYGEIIQYLARTPGETNTHGDRIIQYLNEHYREEIVFEEMAKEIGISYSYMRKIVFEMTGRSLIDYMNLLRIEQAKRLLAESGLTITQIASEIGYNNVRSFNRFFRKFEGMAPSSYKAERSRSAQEEPHS